MTVPSYENPPAQFIYESSTIIFLLFKCVNKTNNIIIDIVNKAIINILIYFFSLINYKILSSKSLQIIG